jgi:hypothetical protein
MTALHPLAKGVRHPAPLRDRVPGWVVVAGLFAAPVAWSAQLLISYGLNGDACRLPGRLAAAQATATSVLVPIIGVVALAGCLFGLWSAFHTWRLTRGEGSGDHHAGLSAGIGRTRFLGLCGLVSGAIFLIATVFSLLVPFLTSPCASAALL